MIPQDLLDILRCPHCASSATRHPGEDPGRLTLVQDAWLAAVAIESGCEWITTDRDYARFAGLAWRAPF